MARTRSERIAEDMAELEALTGGDPESAHLAAERILLRWVPPKIREAWQEAARRTPFWYA